MCKQTRLIHGVMISLSSSLPLSLSSSKRLTSLIFIWKGRGCSAATSRICAASALSSAGKRPGARPITFKANVSDPLNLRVLFPRFHSWARRERGTRSGVRSSSVKVSVYLLCFIKLKCGRYHRCISMLDYFNKHTRHLINSSWFLLKDTNLNGESWFPFEILGKHYTEQYLGLIPTMQLIQY